MKILKLVKIIINFKDQKDIEIEDSKDIYETTDIFDDMITLSSFPKSRWQTLLNLESIKKRNKPIQPPQAPKLAPFFLPTISKYSNDQP